VHARLAFGERVQSEGAPTAGRASSAQGAAAPQGLGDDVRQGDDLRLGDSLWPMPPKPLFASPRADSFGDMHASSYNGVRQWGLKGGTGLTLLAFVVLYGGIVLLQRNEQPESQPQQVASRIVQGSVKTNDSGAAARMAAPAAQPRSASNAAALADRKADHAATKPAVPVIATAPPPDALKPSQSTSVPSLSQATLADAAPPPSSHPAISDAAPLSPSSQSMAVQTPPPSSQSNPLNASVHAPSPPAHSLATRASSSRSWNGRAQMSPSAYLAARGPSPAGVPDQQQPSSRRDRGRDGSASPSLASARAALEKNDLAAAHAALAAQPKSGPAYMLRQDLASRESSRDALLKAARACVVQERWHCVWHNAGDALSIDSSSVEAKALIERSIVDSGAASTPPGPGPGPDIPAVQ
jgi:hypothetical protein